MADRTDPRAGCSRLSCGPLLVGPPTSWRPASEAGERGVRACGPGSKARVADPAGHLHPRRRHHPGHAGFTRSSSWWSPSPSIVHGGLVPTIARWCGVSMQTSRTPNPGHWVSDCVINPKGRGPLPGHHRRNPPMADQCAKLQPRRRHMDQPHRPRRTLTSPVRAEHRIAGPVTKSPRSSRPTPKSKPTSERIFTSPHPRKNRSLTTPRTRPGVRTGPGWEPRAPIYMPNRARRTASTAAAGPDPPSTCGRALPSEEVEQ